MALFVAHHQHSPETCPAKDPQMGQMLLQHLSAENAGEYGVTIHGEAVLDGRHELYVIAEAPDQMSMERFLQPFAAAGTVEVWPSSQCGAVVARGGCEVAAL